MIYGIQIKHVQDEHNQHALLVRPATSSEWRVYIRHHSFHVVFGAERSLQSSLARHGWEAGDFLELPVAAFRQTSQKEKQMALPLFQTSSPAAQPLVDILNVEREALGNLPPMPRLALFDSAEGRAEKQARAAEIQRQREAIEAETIAKVRALAEQGDMVARGFLAYERMRATRKRLSPPRGAGATTATIE